jgi:spore maturation protein SpmB
MMMNFSANLLNLDNAATPFGIKTMESLQELNPDKEKATNAQLMFLCLHAAGLTLVPVTIIAARASVKPAAASPTDIFVPCMIATFVATMAAMIMVAIKQKINLLQPVILGWVLGADTRFVDGLPTALIKPLSGGGARGMMIDTMNTHGADSFAGRLASVLQGSSDTTFYVVAVYFGAVGIKNTRYAISTMLIADLVGIITSILLCYLFFGNA